MPSGASTTARPARSLVLMAALTGCVMLREPRAEATHTAWLNAMQTSDQAAAIALLADAAQASPRVRAYLERLQRDADPGTARTGGTLTAVTDLGLVQAEGAIEGMSAWHYARTVICRTATLVQTDAGWRVQRWDELPAACM